MESILSAYSAHEELSENTYLAEKVSDQVIP